jgi:hypothetical protein
MKLIKLTNNHAQHKGSPLYINIDHITSVYSLVVEDGMQHTFVYGGPTGESWDVEESVSEIILKIENVQQSRI